ncbi:S1 family peptidase [Actinokineospora sp. UTMC 2448]|uniref:S1 family peptidase n=1 Tax=Actinokineospora sp. UTMC 2448 TaxID=2268449 RepID=UPI00220D2DEF|nr:S1 family peptidase [Actinokineospora sp. UTMC 2448]UVS77476.1 Alpha-lytic protease precursor [Actinokineospora sp. UTMC 2448]
MARKVTAVLGAAIMAAGTFVALAPTVSAAPVDTMHTALQRDLGLTSAEATVRLADEATASRADRTIRKRLGHRFGGSWYDAATGSLVVGATDPASARTARAAGAEVRMVTRSEATLDKLKARLDANRAAVPASVIGWHVDVTTNSIVVSVRPNALADAHRFARASGVPMQAVRVQASTEAPRPLIDVVGGNAYYIGSGTRCSIGFSVNGGFITAGHCGRRGATTSQPSGTFSGSSFPGDDMAYVAVSSGNTMIAAVNNYNGGRVAVAGSQDAPVGSSICRSGSTTGWHCGTIQARNSTVNYPEGSVYGLIRTTVCAEPGDSGGSAISGNQAQGVTSGGSGNCRTGGTTYFQPVNEILQTYGRTLLTSGGGGNPPDPADCDGASATYTGSLSSGGQQAQPNGSYYYSSSSGGHLGCLTGPSGTDFDLYLQKWNGSTWQTVASGTTPAASERVTYTGTAGYYRWIVHAYSGSGSYSLATGRP